MVVVPVGRHEVCEVLYSRSGRKKEVFLPSPSQWNLLEV